MKLLTIIAAFILLSSCNNNSSKAKVYEDSANYYSDRMTELSDSGYSTVDSIYQQQKHRYFIYQTMRQYYIDKMKEAE